MKVKLLLSILAVALLGCSDGTQSSPPRRVNTALEFHQAKSDEVTGWIKMQHNGRSIWINPVVEMDASEISVAKLERTPFYEERKREDDRAQAEFENAYPDAVRQSSLSEYIISLTFTKNGSKMFRDVTANCIGNQLAIMHNGKVLIAPTVYEPISGGEATISTKELPQEQLEEIIKEINAE